MVSNVHSAVFLQKKKKELKFFWKKIVYTQLKMKWPHKKHKFFQHVLKKNQKFIDRALYNAFIFKLHINYLRLSSW